MGRAGLSRAEKVIRFVETLPCTAGPLAGTTLKLRPWQKRFIRAVYRTDKAGNRVVRTAVLSMGRKVRKDPARCRSVPVRLIRSRSRTQGRMLLASPARETRPSASSTRWLRSSRAYRGSTSASTSSVSAASWRTWITARRSACCRQTSRQFSGSTRVSSVTTNSARRRTARLYDALGTALGGRAQPLMLVIRTQAATR